MALELYINYEDRYTGLGRADLYPDEGILLKRELLSDTGIDNSNKQFTRDFNIPATPTNNELLQHWELKSNESTLNPNIAIPARIEIDDIYTITGQIELLSVTWKNRQPHSYKIVFYGGTSGLRAKLGETLLEEIDWVDFEFIYDRDSIIASWAADATNYYVPIISWSRWYKWFTAGTDLDDIATEATGVLLTELRVGLSLKQMITTIGNHVGITFLLTGKIDTFLDEAFVIPSRYEDQALTVSPTIFNTDVQTFPTQPIHCPDARPAPESVMILGQINYDPRGRWTSSQYYTAEFNGNYAFEITFENLGSNAVFDFYLVRDTDDVVVGSQNTGNTGGDSIELTAVLQEGVVYRFEWECDKAGGRDCYVQILTTLVPATIIGETYEYADNMPPVTAVDFLSGFINTFNLIIYQSGENEWTITDTPSLFLGETEVIDLEKYVDEKILTYEKIRVFSQINFKHKISEDSPNKVFFDTAGRQFGELDFLPGVDFSDGELVREGMFTVFPPTYISTYDAGGANGRTDLWHHYHLTNNTPPEPQLSQFLLLYRNGVEDTTYPYYLQDYIDGNGDPTFLQATTYGRYSQNQRQISDADTNTFSYAYENPYIGSPAEQTITNAFWTDWLIQLYKRNAYTVSVSFPINFGVYLKINDITIVYLNGFYHFTSKWEYNSATGILTLELLRFDRAQYVLTEEVSGRMKLLNL